MDKQEFNISLSDLTLIEGNGLFNKVSKIMKEDNMLSEKWMNVCFFISNDIKRSIIQI